MDIKVVNISQLYGLDGQATLKCFLHQNYGEMAIYNQKLPALVIAPGGGYGFVSEREGDPIAVDFFNRHYNTFVLKYTVAPEGRYPLALTQYACAIDYIKQHAEEFSVDPERISICGFSAGGHLTANLANFWWRLPVPEAGGRVLDAKPFAAILAYPVIFPDSHQGSFKNLLGIDDVHCAEAEALSLDKSVTDKNPPSFVWTLRYDTAVDPMATVRYTTALIKAGIVAETHIFAKGGHGGSTFDERTLPLDNCVEQNTVWLDLADIFLKGLE